VDGSCVRLRPAYADHVGSCDFVADRTSDGRAVRMLTLIEERTRECLAIDAARRLASEDVLERLSDLFVRRGAPAYLRGDNGAEFTATKVREWLERVGVKTLFIELDTADANAPMACWISMGRSTPPRIA
jgi:putative transposase